MQSGSRLQLLAVGAGIPAESRYIDVNIHIEMCAISYICSYGKATPLPIRLMVVTLLAVADTRTQTDTHVCTFNYVNAYMNRNKKCFSMYTYTSLQVMRWRYVHVEEEFCKAVCWEETRSMQMWWHVYR